MKKILLLFAALLSISVSALTIGGKQWQGCIGVGIRLGKAKVVMKPFKQR